MINFKNKNIAFLFLVVNIFFASFVYAENVNWQGYEEGIKKAKKEQKKIFVHFYSSDCYYCVKMENKTFKSAKVKKLLDRHFVSVMVDAKKEMRLSEKYRVFGLPANFFLTSDTELIGSMPGYINPNKMLKVLKVIKKFEKDDISDKKLSKK